MGNDDNVVYLVEFFDKENGVNCPTNISSNRRTSLLYCHAQLMGRMSDPGDTKFGENSNGTLTELETRTVTVDANGSFEKSTSTKFSDVADGSEYVIEVRGDGDQNSMTGVFYDDTRGGTDIIYGSNPLASTRSH